MSKTVSVVVASIVKYSLYPAVGLSYLPVGWDWGHCSRRYCEAERLWVQTSALNQQLLLGRNIKSSYRFEHCGSRVYKQYLPLLKFSVHCFYICFFLDFLSADFRQLRLWLRAKKCCIQAPGKCSLLPDKVTLNCGRSWARLNSYLPYERASFFFFSKLSPSNSGSTELTEGAAFFFHAVQMLFWTWLNNTRLSAFSPERGRSFFRTVERGRLSGKH